MTKKHFEAPFNKVLNDYNEQLIEAGKQNYDKLINAVIKQGYTKELGESLLPACLWLTLDYQERLDLSRSIRKARISLHQVHINKLDAILEEESSIDVFSDYKIPRKGLEALREELRERLADVKTKTKAGHLKELISFFILALLGIASTGIEQSKQVLFIYELMKEFDFKWEKEYNVYREEKFIASFHNEAIAIEYVEAQEIPKDYNVKFDSVSVNELPDEMILSNIRVQFQQSIMSEYKSVLEAYKEFEVLQSEV